MIICSSWTLIYLVCRPGVRAVLIAEDDRLRHEGTHQASGAPYAHGPLSRERDPSGGARLALTRGARAGHRLGEAIAVQSPQRGKKGPPLVRGQGREHVPLDDLDDRLTF